MTLVLTLNFSFVNSYGGKSVKFPLSECCRMQNWAHGFHHMSNTKPPQLNAARILIKTNKHYLIRYQGHGTFKINHGLT